MPSAVENRQIQRCQIREVVCVAKAVHQILDRSLVGRLCENRRNELIARFTCEIFSWNFRFGAAETGFLIIQATNSNSKYLWILKNGFVCSRIPFYNAQYQWHLLFLLFTVL